MDMTNQEGSQGLTSPNLLPLHQVKMTLVGFKTILHKKCRYGKNSEGPAENSWMLNLCPAK
jgi:hypothetical protein